MITRGASQSLAQANHVPPLPIRRVVEPAAMVAAYANDLHERRMASLAVFLPTLANASPPRLEPSPGTHFPPAGFPRFLFTTTA